MTKYLMMKPIEKIVGVRRWGDFSHLSQVLKLKKHLCWLCLCQMVNINKALTQMVTV